MQIHLSSAFRFEISFFLFEGHVLVDKHRPWLFIWTMIDLLKFVLVSLPSLLEWGRCYSRLGGFIIFFELVIVVAFFLGLWESFRR